MGTGTCPFLFLPLGIGFEEDCSQFIGTLKFKQNVGWENGICSPPPPPPPPIQDPLLVVKYFFYYYLELC